MIDRLGIEEFIAKHADPLWLHQNEMWQLLPPESESEGGSGTTPAGPDDTPF